MGKKPWDLTAEERQAEYDRLRERRRAADRRAAPLFLAQQAKMDTENEELAAERIAACEGDLEAMLEAWALELDDAGYDEQ